MLLLQDAIGLNQVHFIKNLLGDNFSELLTEQENMLSNDYQIFFDAGNYKFEF